LNLYNKSADGDWEGPQTLLHGNAPSGYTRWQAALALGDEGQIIHMSFMLYEGDGPGYAIGYWHSHDRGKTWKRSDGTEVQLPATPATIEIVEGTQDPTNPMNLRPGNVAVAPRGTPWLIYSRLDRQPFETWLAHPSGYGKWQRISLLPAIQQAWPRRTVKTPGEIVFSRDGVMYVAVTTVDANASAERAYWGHQSAEVALLVSKDSGNTFEVFGVSPPDKAVPNWLPSLERPTRHVPIGIPSLMYTHGHRGKTNTQIVSNEVVWCNVAELMGSKR